jgi:hypothetical protein
MSRGHVMVIDVRINISVKVYVTTLQTGKLAELKVKSL